MPNKKKKRKIEVIESLQLEVKQLKAVLAESRRYADKLVDHIPYLPADIENLREANTALALENEQLKEANKEVLPLLDAVIVAASQFTLSDEFPGPYILEDTPLAYKIRSKSGDIVASTFFQDFSVFICNVLNVVDTLKKEEDN
jgi:FtsZ-binding cell division protein ZapB